MLKLVRGQFETDILMQKKHLRTEYPKTSGKVTYLGVSASGSTAASARDEDRSDTPAIAVD